MTSDTHDSRTRFSAAAVRFAVSALVSLLTFAPWMMAAPQLSEWSAPFNLGAVINSTFNDIGPALSKDGLSLYFSSNRPGGAGVLDIWVSQREDAEAPWGAPRNLGATINTAFTEGVPTLSRDGHWLFFNSDRPGGVGGTDIWVSWRAHTHDDFGWQPPVNLGPQVNTASGDSIGSYFDNEEAGTPLLFISSNRPGTGMAPGGPYVSQLIGDLTFGPATLITELDSPVDDMRPMIRFDGREIFLSSNRLPTFGARDLWVSLRNAVSDPWATPLNVGPVVNSASNELTPYLSSDGHQLFFASDRPGGFGAVDIYVTTRDTLRRNKDH